jgi:transposase
MRAVELFEVLASTTWHTLYRTNRNRIVFGEDAITSINLNAVFSLNNHSIAVEDTRVDEAHKGCDFELWIGSNGRGWSRYAVQAKKITMNSGRYEQLNHEVRGRRQIDILTHHAKGVRAAPLYCFYNFAPQVSTWNCSLRRDEPQLGCTVTPAEVVEQALCIRGSRNFAWIHQQPETIPWRCLITCPKDHQYKFPACLKSRWTAQEAYSHEHLPEELEVLRNRARDYQLVDPTTLQYDGASESELLPRWTAIVDTGPEDPPDSTKEFERRKRGG